MIVDEDVGYRAKQVPSETAVDTSCSHFGGMAMATTLRVPRMLLVGFIGACLVTPDVSGWTIPKRARSWDGRNRDPVPTGDPGWALRCDECHYPDAVSYVVSYVIKGDDGASTPVYRRVEHLGGFGPADLSGDTTHPRRSDATRDEDARAPVVATLLSDFGEDVMGSLPEFLQVATANDASEMHVVEAGFAPEDREERERFLYCELAHRPFEYALALDFDPVIEITDVFGNTVVVTDILVIAEGDPNFDQMRFDEICTDSDDEEAAETTEDVPEETPAGSGDGSLN